MDVNLKIFKWRWLKLLHVAWKRPSACPAKCKLQIVNDIAVADALRALLNFLYFIQFKLQWNQALEDPLSLNFQNKF